MLNIGRNDAFEQAYMAKFEQLAAHYGVFVKYERDRAARDIGLHLTKAAAAGAKHVTNSLVWFQMKGVMATTLTKEKYDEAGNVSLTMEVEHLRHWYLDKEPTHLVVYVEAADKFLVLNLQEYIAKEWGRTILTLKQKTATVTVPASSVLDKQAFAILLRQADISQWAKALDADLDDVALVHRDFQLILAVGTAAERRRNLTLVWIKWLSKMRHELRISERPDDFNGGEDEGWEVIHEHWEYGGIDLGARYPYLELYALKEYEPETFINRWGEEELEEDGEIVTLNNGDVVFGPNLMNEYCPFVFGVRLNDKGDKLHAYVNELIEIGLLHVSERKDGERTFIDIAPWHSRLV